MNLQQQLIQILQDHESDYVSGEQLSQHLQCSRTAIWKHIQKLKQGGYEIEAVHRLGYRLLSSPATLDEDWIANNIKTTWMGKRLLYYKEVESTQDIAKNVLQQSEKQSSAENGTVIIAETQTKGRGRMGRHWHSPLGKGLWFSIILKPDLPLQQVPQLTLLVSVALCRTLRKFGLDAGIKWPNDIHIAGKKVSGILLESSADDQRVHYTIAGIGIAVNLEKDDYPTSLHPIAVSMKMAAEQTFEREEVLCTFLCELEAIYSIYMEQGFAPIKTLWETLTISLHKPITINTPQEVIHGTAIGIDDYGAMKVEVEDGEGKRSIRTIFSGDVNFQADGSECR
ncbi:biotin--[acetyl-CoA-carboxylase] ligase [Longirhabdus pacifica]|uniref:biotin--[acetyl-CoA-carboxylase] ligase n=1 Tax=Longirhabdus pacifica TaxID=2305227 RepID=UPI001008F4EC|nr:biotin--[acetyl-CoA-carboxylase] ligase [Longirhabdus pacifica]